MNTQKPASPPELLRRDAEAALAGAPAGNLEGQTAAELLYELQVHQIELEMQNESLRQNQLTLEESRDRYVDLYEFSPVGYLTLSRDGVIAAINLTGAEQLGEERKKLLQRRFARFVLPEDSELWQTHFLQAFQDDARQINELRLKRRDGTVFAASLNSRLATANEAPPMLRLAITDVSARWRAERALQESEARFRAMADSAPAMIWVAGLDKGCSWLNQQWLQFTGRGMAQELGNGWTERVHPDDFGRCLAVYTQAFDRRESFEMKYRLQRADGEYRWLLDHGVPRYGAEREFLGYIGSCIDVTRLEEARDDLNRAQKVGHIGSWRLDVKRNQLTWSAENHRIFGLPEGKPLTYETFLSRVHPDDAAYVDRMWQAGLRGEPYDIEHRLLIDGEVKWVREKAELEFDGKGQLVGGFGITQDISEIKLTRQALTDAEERFRAFMTHSKLASWIVDAEGRYQYVSPNYHKIFGVPAIDLIGKRFSEVYPAELAILYQQSNQAVIESWQSIEIVHPGLRADGRMGEFLIVKLPVRDANGQPLVCGMALDITESRQNLADLRAANERLENVAQDQAAHLHQLAGELTRAEQHERDRLYELLHDEVQPLLVSARLSLSSVNQRTAPDDCTRIAGEACAHISQTLQIARSLSLQLSPPRIREHGLVPALESLCRWVKDNHRLTVALAAEAGVEPADVAKRLHCFNAVRELLMNVAKHAQTEHVALTLQLASPDLLRIVVADQGCGFDPAAGATGTGLSSIERRLRMFGGALQIDSRPGEGTVATLTMPLRPATRMNKQAQGPKQEKERQDAQNIDRR